MWFHMHERVYIYTSMINNWNQDQVYELGYGWKFKQKLDVKVDGHVNIVLLNFKTNEKYKFFIQF